MSRKPFKYTDIDVSKAAASIGEFYDLASDKQKEDGRQWYRVANAFLRDVASDYGAPFAAVAGAFSALSVGNKLSQNCRDLFAILDMGAGANVATYSRQKDKALAMLAGDDPRIALGKLKTRAFWHNLVAPDTAGRVTIDRHAVRICWPKLTAADVSTGRYTKTAAKYRQWEQAYILAAGRVALLPHELQAITWLVWRDNFLPARYQDSGRKYF
jgi:hypothetical protein